MPVYMIYSSGSFDSPHTCISPYIAKSAKNLTNGSTTIALRSTYSLKKKLVYNKMHNFIKILK